MYKIEFLPIAKEDINNIIYYISHKLNNITAAKKLRNLFIKSLDYIIEFPYGSTVYPSSKTTLKYEYRSYKIKNYLLFYTINENQKLITITRVK